jgi:type VI secretion system protein ImpK
MVTESNEDPFAPRDGTVFRPRPGAGKRAPDRPTNAEPRPFAARLPARAPTAAALRDFAALGLNPLVQAASPLLILMGRLRTSLSNPDVAGLRRQVLQQMREFEERALAAGVDKDTVRSARYVLCAALDEAVLSTPWGGQSEWGGQTLLVTLHHETWGGEKFFDMIEGLSHDPGRHIDLLELQYLCLALGFAGKYAVAERGAARLAAIQNDLYRRIRTLRGNAPTELAVHWRGMLDRRNPVIRYVPWWTVGALALVVLMGTYLYFRSELAALAAPISARLAQVGLEAPAAVLASAPSAAPRLAQLLRDDAAAGTLRVEERNNQTVVTLTAADLFGSGSAKVNPKYYPTFDRIARALNQVQGRVAVVGHTDDQPVRSLKFQDNFELSRARAAGVVQLLGLAIDRKARLEASGAGDSQPRYTPASTPENRARNRRVEIVHTGESP